MKKLLLILVGVGLTVGVLAAAGYVYAQTGDTTDLEEEADLPLEDRPFAWDKAFFGGHGFGDFGDGLLGEYLLPALADVFGFSDEEVDSFQVVQDTIQAIKDDYSIDEIHEMLSDAYSTAVSAAVADGTITQEQADQMLEHREMLGNRTMGGFAERGMRGGVLGHELSFGVREAGILDKYMDAALIEVLGISDIELQSMKADGFNLRDYAEENDLSDEELASLMAEIHTYAINLALKDGAITKEQADMMLENVGEYGARVPFDLGFNGGIHGNRNGGK